MSSREEALVFECCGSRLVGVLHRAEHVVAQEHPIAVLNVVGGPQYRVGSHRQFVQIARRLAAHGYPVFRFDYRGMGDSEGESRTFESVAEDIACAMSVVRECLPDHSIVMMGLCDGASAVLMQPEIKTSVVGIALLNPWVRTASSVARAYTRHYYRARILSADFWSKVIGLNWDIRGSVASFARNIRRAVRPVQREASPSFVERMQRGLATLTRPVLIVLSERDLTAQEFQDATVSDPKWSALMRRPNVHLAHLVGADHTLSNSPSLDAFLVLLLDWLAAIREGGRVHREEVS